MADVKDVARNGFSLVELLIVIGILAIFAAFAYPNYRDHVLRSNRSDAHIAIQKAVAKQELYYSIRHEYSDQIDDIGGSTTQDERYQLSVVNRYLEDKNNDGNYECSELSDPASASSYTIIATPTSEGGQNRDFTCSQICFDNRGVKGWTINSEYPGKCW
ncbi:type IV pilin protein [Parendozoicomonas haliclonae]|uniref:Fimbrial protein n=1 Tax=Parendozoicomonas haliclonae TaxID=1960125 RepID=A0A1X7AQ52_9GAMM|nr:type IV pilin protein [Parendozoicomonas haliclonae]SMA50375.1 Fimbrial protein precursor [Parendozoicomonas haliclonae]